MFEEEANKLEGIDYLVQGTVYPDVIESGTDTAEVIKSHHNVGGLPEDMKFSLIEPLRDLFKDEVRRVGEEIGVPGFIVWRQPFPGPGLAIRIIGEITEDALHLVRESDAILQKRSQKLASTEMYGSTSQCSRTSNPSVSWAMSVPTHMPSASALSRPSTA